MSRKTHLWTLAMALPVFAVAGQALANNAADYYTVGKLERNSQPLWINTGIPSGCRYTITDAGTTWTNAPSVFSFVWSGYVDAASWNWSGTDNVSTTANTLDTVVQLGITDMANSLAQVEWRYRSYDAATGRYLFADGDVIVNHSKMSGTVFWCSPSLPVPSNMWDFETTMLHELGHVMGMYHDLDDSTAVMWADQNGGAEKRTLRPRDVTRATYLYG